MARVLIIGAGNNQYPLIEKASQLGLETVAVDGDPTAPGKDICNRFIHKDIKNTDGIINELKDIQIDAVLSSAEAGVLTAAQISKYFNLPGIPVESSKILLNKELMRLNMKRTGLLVPWFASYYKVEDIMASAESLSFPLIMKPVDSSGSKGIIKVENLDDIRKNFLFTIKESNERKLLLEEYIDGEEISVEGIIHEGKLNVVAFTGKVRTDAPYRLDLGIYIGADVGKETEIEIEEVLDKFLKPLNIKVGCIHAELILSSKGPLIVEIAGRMGGGRIPSHLVPMAYGIDMLKAAIDISLGRKPELERKHIGGSALFWLQAKPGVITEISGIEDAMSIDGVVGIYTDLKPGNRVEEFRSSAERDKMGFVIVTGDSGREAMERATKAVTAIKIETVK